MTSQHRPPKRTLDSLDEKEIDGTLDPSSESPPPAKKRAVENVNVVDRTSTIGDTLSTPASKPLYTSAPFKSKQGPRGAPAGKPDIDVTFLAAVASKRAEADEDEDDSDFPKIRIRKEETEQRSPQEEWAVLADFGDDSAPRGNFMVVVELEPYTSGRSKSLTSLPNHCWDRKPDFKKFRKV